MASALMVIVGSFRLMTSQFTVYCSQTILLARHKHFGSRLYISLNMSKNIITVAVISFLIGTCVSQNPLLNCTNEEKAKFQQDQMTCVESITTFGAQNVHAIVIQPERSVFVELCTRVKEVINCSFAALENQKCTSFVVGMTKHAKVAAMAALNYMCKNEAAIAFELFSSQVFPCMTVASGPIQNCTVKALKTQLLPNIMQFQKDPSFVFSVLDKFVMPVKTCISNVIESKEQCNNKIAVILNDGLDIIVDSATKSFNEETKNIEENKKGEEGMKTKVIDGEPNENPNHDESQEKVKNKVKDDEEKKDDGSGDSSKISFSILLLLVPLALPFIK